MTRAPAVVPKSIIEYGQRCLLCRGDSLAGGTVCWKHSDEMGAMLDPDNTGNALAGLPASIPVMFSMLDASPGASGLAERRAPGFGSTPPCSLHIITMRDDRSHAYPVVDEWFSSRGDSPPDLAHPHHEDEHPPRAIAKSLAGLAAAVQDEIHATGHAACMPCPVRVHALGLPTGVAGLAAWLYARVRVLARLGWANDAYRDLRDLREQLRDAIGDPALRPIGHCTNPLAEVGSGVQIMCGHALYPPEGVAPTAPDEPVRNLPIVTCGRCHAVYDGLAQLRLRVAELEGAS